MLRVNTGFCCCPDAAATSEVLPLTCGDKIAPRVTNSASLPNPSLPASARCREPEGIPWQYILKHRPQLFLHNSGSRAVYTCGKTICSPSHLSEFFSSMPLQLLIINSSGTFNQGLNTSNLDASHYLNRGHVTC